MAVALKEVEARDHAEEEAAQLQAMLVDITDQVDQGVSPSDAVRSRMPAWMNDGAALLWLKKYGERAIAEWWKKQSQDAQRGAFRVDHPQHIGGGAPNREWNTPTLRSALGDDLWTIVRFKIDGEWVCYGDMRKHHVHAMVLRADERIGHFRAEKLFWEQVEKKYKTDEQPLKAVLSEEDHYRLRSMTGARIGKGDVDVDVDAEIAELEEE